MEVLLWKMMIEHNTSANCPKEQCGHAKLEYADVGFRIKYCRTCNIYFHRDVVAPENNVFIFKDDLKNGVRHYEYVTLKQKDERNGNLPSNGNGDLVKKGKGKEKLKLKDDDEESSYVDSCDEEYFDDEEYAVVDVGNVGPSKNPRSRQVAKKEQEQEEDDVVDYTSEEEYSEVDDSSDEDYDGF